MHSVKKRKIKCYCLQILIKLHSTLPTLIVYVIQTVKTGKIINMRNMCAVQRLRKQINYNELKYILKGRDNPLRGFVTNLHKSRGETSLWFQYILLAHCTLADVCENCSNSLPLALSWTVVGSVCGWIVSMYCMLCAGYYDSGRTLLCHIA